MSPVCLDLCSGLGGLSQAFVDDARWRVIRVDSDPTFLRVPYTHLGDVRQEGFGDFIRGILQDEPVTVIVASPPCERFSIANRRFPEKGIRQALDLVGAVFEIIAELRPKYWIVENPKGRLRWFLGSPTSSVHLSNYGSRYMKPTDLWHNLTFKLIQAERPGQPSLTSHQNRMKGSTGLLRLRDPAKRALMPRGLSEAVLEAVSHT